MPRGHPKELRLDQIPPRWIATFVRHIIVGDGCWEWGAARNSTGYGAVGITGYGSSSAHRVAFVVFHKQAAPYGMDVGHSCNNPGCVNPAHLALCTRGQNIAYSISTDRWFIGHGEDSLNAKLKDADVDEMRLLHSRGVAVKDIAAQFQIDSAHANGIINGTRRTKRGCGRVPMKRMLDQRAATKKTEERYH